MKNMYIISSMNTKAEETLFLKDLIEKRGFPVKIIDVGYGSDPEVEPDITMYEVVEAAGVSKEQFLEWRTNRDRDNLSLATRTGAAVVLNKLIKEKDDVSLNKVVTG